MTESDFQAFMRLLPNVEQFDDWDAETIAKWTYIPAEDWSEWARLRDNISVLLPPIADRLKDRETFNALSLTERATTFYLIHQLRARFLSIVGSN